MENCSRNENSGQKRVFVKMLYVEERERERGRAWKIVKERNVGKISSFSCA